MTAASPVEEDTPEAKIAAALDIAYSNAGFDGGHHKMWVIDQMLRKLLGDGYDEWIIEWQYGEDGPETYVWDVGIPP